MFAFAFRGCWLKLANGECQHWVNATHKGSLCFNSGNSWETRVIFWGAHFLFQRTTVEDFGCRQIMIYSATVLVWCAWKILSKTSCFPQTKLTLWNGRVLSKVRFMCTLLRCGTCSKHRSAWKGSHTTWTHKELPHESCVLRHHWCLLVTSWWCKTVAAALVAAAEESQHWLPFPHQEPAPINYLWQQPASHWASCQILRPPITFAAKCKRQTFHMKLPCVCNFLHQPLVGSNYRPQATCVTLRHVNFWYWPTFCQKTQNTMSLPQLKMKSVWWLQQTLRLLRFLGWCPNPWELILDADTGVFVAAKHTTHAAAQ